MLYRLLKRVKDNYNKKISEKACKRWTYNGSGNFYATSRVENIQKDPNKIRIGDNCHIRGELLIFAYGGEITIGNNCFIGEGSRIWSGEKVEIGSHVLVSHNVNIIDTNSHEMDHQLRAKGFVDMLENGHPKDKTHIETKPIVIKDYAWISLNAAILKGVTIGEGAIVAAGSVVLEDVEPFTLVGGNPARVLKRLDQK